MARLKKVVKTIEEVRGNIDLKVSRTMLVKGVDLVSLALPNKDYGDATSGIMLETKYVKENGTDIPVLFLTSNRMEVFIKYGIKLQDDCNCGIIVPNGGLFAKIVKNLKALKNPIEISYDDNEETMHLNCGTEYSGKLKTYNPIGFIQTMESKEIKKFETISIPVKLIKESLEKVAFACSKDQVVINLTGIYINQTKNEINFVGGDGMRLARVNFKTKIINPKSVIVGVKFLNLLKHVLDMIEVGDSEILEFYIGEDMMYFTYGYMTMGIQLYAGEYPSQGDYRKYLHKPEECDVSMRILREDLIEKLSLAISHNSSSEEIIKMKLISNTKVVFVNDLSINEFSIEFKLLSLKNITNKKMTMRFIPQLLLDVLSKIKDKEILLSIKDAEMQDKDDAVNGPAIVTPVEEKENADYIYVFSLSDK